MNTTTSGHQFVDTHCHVHMADYALPPDEVIKHAAKDGIDRLICVGTDAEDSQRAVNLALKYNHIWASVGLHPHDAKLGEKPLADLRKLLQNEKHRGKIVAVGECGLDYYYNHSPKAEQESAFRSQLKLAGEFNLPLIFHVREAFTDFWRILEDFPNARGVVHSFSTTTIELDQVLNHDLYVGLNGIMTFSKNEQQLGAAKAVPLDRLLLETDAPFLTPSPQRGTVNEPRYVALVAAFLADLRQESLADIAAATTANALELFNLE